MRFDTLIRPRRPPMPRSVIGAQLYTVRDFAKTPTDIANTCARLRKIGYEVVQVSGIAPIDAKELVKILDGEGLACVVTHKSMDELRQTSAVVDYHQTLK